MRLPRSAAVFVALCLGCGQAGSGQGEAPAEKGAARCAKRVLVIVDDVPDGAGTIATALVAAGFEVTTSSASSSDFAGRPALAGEASPFDAVLLLAGGPPRTPPADMPPEGQKALVDFVAAGHGLVISEWAAYHVAASPAPRWQILKPLVLLERERSFTGQVTYTVEPAFASHPIWEGLPASFTFSSGSNVGAMPSVPGAARVATSPQAGAAVALLQAPRGRVVHLAHAGNHASGGWSNVHVQRLVANAIGWAAGCK
jgi:hypothetical protein